MDSPLLPVIAGFIAAALVLPMGWGARRAWAWLRRDRLVARLVQERDTARREHTQACRTIQALNKQLGNTETQFIPLSVSRRWAKE